MSGYTDAASLKGKTISRVIVSEGREGSFPASQLFLEFTDGTYAELYCDKPVSVSAPRTGDPLEYARRFPGVEITVL